MIVEQIYNSDGSTGIYTRYREHGDLIEHTHDVFTSYFWVPVDSDISEMKKEFPNAQVPPTNAQSIDGKELMKINAHSQNDMYGMRGYFDETYEADVPAADRWLIDNVETMPDWEPRKCWFDIEWNPDDSNDFTQCWAALDSFTNEGVCFGWREGQQEYEVEYRDGYVSHIYCSEEAVHEAVIQYIEEMDFDMLIAHAAMWADIPHMVRRFKDYRRLSPIQSVSKLREGYDSYKYTQQPIRGRWVLDTAAPGSSGTGIERGWMDSGNGQLPSRKLNDIGLLFGLGEKDDVDLSNDWQENYERLTDYCFQDVKLMKACDEYVRCSDFFINMVRFCGVTLSSTYNVGNFARGLVCRRTDLKFPTRHASRRRERGDLKGATVMEPTPGLHEGVLVVDFKGLYPSIMLGNNLCWTTQINAPEGCIECGFANVDCLCGRHKTLTNGTTWLQEPQGILPSIIEYLFEERQLFKDAGEGGLEKAVKRVMASLYGLTAETLGHGMADPVLADTILTEGRHAVETMADYAYSMGHEVLFGHTDSCFVKCPLDQIDTVAKVLTSVMQQETGNLSLIAEPEAWMPYWFCADVKNRYAGTIQWPEKDAGRLKVSGFEMKHSSTAPTAATLQRNVLTMLSNGASEIAIGNVVSSCCKSIRNGSTAIEELSVRTRIKKNIEGSETTTHNPNKHYPKIAGGYAKAARYYNWHINSKEPFVSGDSVAWTYVSDTPDGYPQTDVVAYRDANDIKDFTINTEVIITKMIRDKLRLIYGVLGWDLKSITDEFKPTGYW